MDVRRCSEVRRRMALVQAVQQGESIALVARKANCDRKTVYSALARYAQGGLVGLVNQPRGRTANRQPSVQERAIALKLENLHRSARKIAHLLAQEGHRVSRQSVWRWLGEANLNQPLQEGYTRFEHQEPNDLWQGDWMGEEQTGAGPVQLLLFLDDYSRFILRGRFCHRSGRGPVFSALRETFLAYGLPKAILTDRGPEFCAHGGSGETEYQVALRLLGVKPVLARPYHPMTKGKVERLFRFIQRDFLAEVRDEVQSLPELNAAFERWVSWYNQEHRHRALGNRPPARWYHPGEPAPQEDVLAALTLEYPRKAGKDGRISFEGRSYQLPKGYAGARVWVKLTSDGPEVWYRDKAVPSAEVPTRASAEQVWSFGATKPWRSV